MSKVNEQASELWYIYLTRFGYPALISREKAAEILGISRDSVKSLVVLGQLTVDKVTNKIKLYSVADFQSRR